MSSPALTLDGPGPFVNDRFVLSFQAGEALSPGDVVKITGPQTVGKTAGGETFLGVVWNSAPAGRPVAVITRGVVKVFSENAVTAGDLIVGGLGGKVRSVGSALVVGGSGSTLPVVRGIALETKPATERVLVALF
jgi:hypothetical protein